ncbi:MAG: hypothetical protein V3U28_00075 [Candidatus Acidoferrales bacterium]
MFGRFGLIVAERLRARGSIDDLVPPAVAEAIRRRGLYAAR